MTSHSDQLDKLGAALAKARAAFPAIHPDADGQARGGRYRYATLAAVIGAVTESLTANGLSLWQSLEATDEGIRCETTLLHSSGQWIRGTAVVPVEKTTAQGVGSANTYARRYGLSALLCIAPDADDDGAAAEQAPPRRRSLRDAVNGNGNGNGATDAQRKAIYAISRKLGYDDAGRAALLEPYGAKTSSALTRAQASEILDALKEEETKEEQEA